MNSDRFQRVMEVFQRACDLDTKHRAQLLDQSCGNDPELRREVEAMLKHDERPTAVMDSVIAGGGMHILAQEIAKRETGGPWSQAATGRTPQAVPRQIGRYRVIRRIGEGGMGIVYLAEQERPRRTVALKVIKPGMAGRSMLRRFEYEAHILGRLHHPGIAQIYEAGTAPVVYEDDPAGAPPLHQAFLAMEFIEGKNLIAFCESRGLKTRERLGLVVKVCEAVQHAHQRGIIHRDLKPGNILVVDDDSRFESADTAPAQRSGDTPQPPTSDHNPNLAIESPTTRTARVTLHTATRSATAFTPKILDFGVARTMDAEGGLTTLQTSVGQIIGTLPYMSPEQIVGEAGEVDTRTDVYALGVIIYQLLTGRLPYDVGSRSIPEAARMIREEAPARMSSFNRHFRGDIDTIVSKALEKEKSRRYLSAADLGADIERYLAGEPIAAKRDSSMYILRKQLARYRGLFIAVGVFVLALGVFGVVSFVQSQQLRRLAQGEEAAKQRALNALDDADRLRQRAEEQKEIAEAAQRTADAAAERLATELDASRIERGRMLGLAGNIMSADELIWPVFLQHPDSQQAFWALWQAASRANCLATFVAHEGGVPVTALGPNDETLFTFGNDGAARVWHFPSYELIKELIPPRPGITVLNMAMSGDRRAIAITTSDARVRVFDTSTLTPICEFTGAGVTRRALAINRDASLIAFSSAENSLEICSLPDGRCIRSLASTAATAAFAQNDDRIATGEADRRIFIWAPDGEVLGTLEGHAAVASPIAFSPDGATLYTGSYDRDIRIWDLQRWECVRILAAPNGTVRTVIACADGESLVTAGWYWVYIWNINRDRPIRSIAAVTSVVSGTLSHDESVFVVGGEESGTVRTYDLHGVASRDLPPQTGRMSAAFNRDGTVLATGDGVGNVRLWDAATLRLLAELPKLPGRVRSLIFHPNRPILATGCEDDVARLWDLRTGALIRSIPGMNDITSASIDFDAAGERIGIVGATGKFRVLELDSGRELAAFTPPKKTAEAIAVGFSPDGRRLATVSRLAQFFLWDLENPQSPPLDMSQPGVQIWTPVFSPDGKNVLTGGWTREVLAYDTTSGERIRRLEGHGALIAQIALRPSDPSIVASAGGEGTVRMYDWRAGRPLTVFDEFDGWDAITVSFSHDGRYLATGTALGGVRIWDLRYYERHIAGNLEYQLTKWKSQLGLKVDDQRLIEWARAVWRGDGEAAKRARVGDASTWSRVDDAAVYHGVGPEMIAGWGGKRPPPVRTADADAETESANLR